MVHHVQVQSFAAAGESAWAGVNSTEVFQMGSVKGGDMVRLHNANVLRDR